MFVTWSRCELSKANSRPFSQDTPFSQQLLIVCINLIVLFPHAGHPEGPFMNEIFQNFNILFKLFEIGVLLNLIETIELFQFKLVQFSPKFLYFFTQHTCILIKIILIILKISNMYISLLDISLKRTHFNFKFSYIPILLFTWMIFIVMDLWG